FEVAVRSFHSVSVFFPY
ncbi:hypothetical protein D046_3333B, partial [Vibrio parahaemolyticus V-223/04]